MERQDDSARALIHIMSRSFDFCLDYRGEMVQDTESNEATTDHLLLLCVTLFINKVVFRENVSPTQV